jgi:2-polyprenyl-3-methyl-5-hydroxy-6-metoxy-1,4-benzoquinol methylase
LKQHGTLQPARCTTNQLTEGFAEFFKSSGNLINSWIPAADDGNVLEKLKKGAKVADVGCGFGITTLMMAKMIIM